MICKLGSFSKLKYLTLMAFFGLMCFANSSYAVSAIDDFLLSGNTIYGRLNTNQHPKAKMLPPFHVRMADPTGKTVLQENGSSIATTYNQFALRLHDSAFEEQGFTPQFLSVLQKAFVKGGRVIVKGVKDKIKIVLECPGIGQDMVPVTNVFETTADGFGIAQGQLVAEYNHYYSTVRAEAAAKTRKKFEVRASSGSEFAKRENSRKQNTIAMMMAEYKKIIPMVRMSARTSVTITPPESSDNQGPKAPSSLSSSVSSSGGTPTSLPAQ